MRLIILKKSQALKFCRTGEARLELRYDVNNDAARIHCRIEPYSSMYVDLLEDEMLRSAALLNTRATLYHPHNR